MQLEHRETTTTAPRRSHAGAPPTYSVRVSHRARRVRLHVCAEHGLVVVVPPRFDHRRVPDLVRERRVWVERALARVEEHRRHLDSGPTEPLPGRLELQGIDERWEVRYAPSAHPHVRVNEHAGGAALTVSGATDDRERCRAALRRWLHRRARTRLEPSLLSLAAEHGFVVQRVRVGWQRSRWGSCSAAGTVSLNAKLLFLPEPLVRSVLLHELCHTQRLDHSAEFRRLLARVDPNAHDARAALRQAWRSVPAWVDVV